MNYDEYERDGDGNLNSSADGRYPPDGHYAPVENDKDAAKKKKIKTIAVLLAAILAIYAVSTLIQRVNITGRYYEFELRDGEEFFLGENEYIDITFDGKVIGSSGYQSKYKYSSGKITVTSSLFGATMVNTGTIENGVLTYSSSSLWDGSETVHHYRKASSYPGNSTDQYY